MFLGIDFMQDVPLLVIWAYIVVDKEIDACGEEVFCRLPQSYLYALVLAIHSPEMPAHLTVFCLSCSSFRLTPA